VRSDHAVVVISDDTAHCNLQLTERIEDNSVLVVVTPTHVRSYFDLIWVGFARLRVEVGYCLLVSLEGAKASDARAVLGRAPLARPDATRYYEGSMSSYG
jgi:hypothetical protein